MNKRGWQFVALMLASVLVEFVATGATELNDASLAPCFANPAKQKLRSEELQVIVKADQDDRQGSPSDIDWSQVGPRDEARRKRVGEIFGEGCFKDAPDYAAAALVFQHGNISDHFFQTFLWAKRAVELGDTSQRRLMALGLDRYLVNIGHKQLFGSQASKPSMDPKECWCLESVEESFSPEMRSVYMRESLEAQFHWVDLLNANLPNCHPAKYCAKKLLPSPVGSVPGFW